MFLLYYYYISITYNYSVMSQQHYCLLCFHFYNFLSKNTHTASFVAWTVYHLNGSWHFQVKEENAAWYYSVLSQLAQQTVWKKQIKYHSLLSLFKRMKSFETGKLSCVGRKHFSNSPSNTFDSFYCKHVDKPPSVVIIPVSWIFGRSGSIAAMEIRQQAAATAWLSP